MFCSRFWGRKMNPSPPPPKAEVPFTVVIKALVYVCKPNSLQPKSKTTAFKGVRHE